MMSCKECSKDFETVKAFHSHLRGHKMKVKAYYEKHYPKTCLYSGKKLSWKDGDDLKSYISRDFLDKVYLNLYFNNSEWMYEKQRYLSDFLLSSYNKHKVLPSQVELASLPLSPHYLIFRKFLNLSEFIKKHGCKSRFDYDFDYLKPLSLEKVKTEDFTINVDTRETQEYRIFSTVKGKLDVGDYCLAGSLFNGIVIERKSVADFGGTVVAGNERFRRELDRVRESGKYLVVLVEFNIHELQQHRFYGYANASFISHSMRNLARDYSDCMQFVFGINRNNCVKYVIEFLLAGKAIKNIDLQLYVDYQKSVFKSHEFSKKDLEELLNG